MSLTSLSIHTTESTEQTKALAAAIGRCLCVGDLLVLTGDLGAGKTQFAKGVAVGLGITERVTSPTFALHQQYQGSELLHHLDVYRMDDLAETLDLDLPELIDSGVTLIEWGDTIDDVLPPNRLIVRIVVDEDRDDHRSISFEAHPDHAQVWGNRLAGVVG